MQNQEMSMEEILASIRKIISEDKRPSDKKANAPLNSSAHLSLGGHAPILSDPPSPPLKTAPDVLELNQKIQEDGSIQVLSQEALNGSSKNFSSNGTHGNGNMASSSFADNPRARAQAHLPPVPSAASARSLSTREALLERPPQISSSLKAEKEEVSSSLLMSADTAASSVATLHKMKAGHSLAASPNSHLSLEHMVQDILKTWMETNLPSLLQTRTLQAMAQEHLKPLLRAWMDAHLPSLLERVVREQIELLLQK